MAAQRFWAPGEQRNPHARSRGGDARRRLGADQRSAPAGAALGLRLSALASPELPGGGPGESPGNGNFVVTDLQVARGTQGPIPVATGLRIQLPGRGRILSLAEVEVLDGDGVNVALGGRGHPVVHGLQRAASARRGRQHQRRLRGRFGDPHLHRGGPLVGGHLRGARRGPRPARVEPHGRGPGAAARGVRGGAPGRGGRAPCGGRRPGRPPTPWRRPASGRSGRCPCSSDRGPRASSSRTSRWPPPSTWTPRPDGPSGRARAWITRRSSSSPSWTSAPDGLLRLEVTVSQEWGQDHTVGDYRLSLGRGARVPLALPADVRGPLARASTGSRRPPSP